MRAVFVFHLFVSIVVAHVLAFKEDVSSLAIDTNTIGEGNYVQEYDGPAQWGGISGRRAVEIVANGRFTEEILSSCETQCMGELNTCLAASNGDAHQEKNCRVYNFDCLFLCQDVSIWTCEDHCASEFGYCSVVENTTACVPRRDRCIDCCPEAPPSCETQCMDELNTCLTASNGDAHQEKKCRVYNFDCSFLCQDVSNWTCEDHCASEFIYCSIVEDAIACVARKDRCINCCPEQTPRVSLDETASLDETGFSTFLSILGFVDNTVLEAYSQVIYSEICEYVQGCQDVEVISVTENSDGNQTQRLLVGEGTVSYTIDGVITSIQGTLAVSDIMELASNITLWGEAPNDVGNVTVLSSSAEATSQAGQWDYSISRQGNIKVAFNDESSEQEIIMNFNISDRPYDTHLFKDDCSTPITEITSTTVITSRANGFKNVNMKLDVDQEVLQGSDIWSLDNESKLGTLAFCVKISIGNHLAPGVSVNFMETIMNVVIDMQQDFAVVDITTDRDAADATDQTAKVNYYVEAYECNNGTGIPLDPIPHSQGSFLKICIKTNATDVGLANINTLELAQGGTVKSSPITNGEANGLTESHCEDQICFAKTMLVSSFFERENPGEIEVTGTVVMSFGGRRQLVEVSPPTRSLESNKVSNGADFQLQVLLNKQNLEEEESSFSNKDIKRKVTVSMVGGCMVSLSLVGIAAFVLFRQHRQFPGA